MMSDEPGKLLKLGRFICKQPVDCNYQVVEFGKLKHLNTAARGGRGRTDDVSMSDPEKMENIRIIV